MRRLIPLTILLALLSSVSRAQETPRPIPIWLTRAQPELDWWDQVDLPPGFVQDAFGGIQSAVNELAAKNLQLRLHLGLLENALTFLQKEGRPKPEVPSTMTKKKPATKP